MAKNLRYILLGSNTGLNRFLQQSTCLNIARNLTLGHANNKHGAHPTQPHMLYAGNSLNVRTQPLNIPPRRFAGHSKWDNIRHIKAEKDGIKQAIINSVTRRIRIAVKEGGSTNPKLNNHLARLLEEAKQKDVPSATIKAALKRLETSKSTGSTMYIEARGVGNCFIIMEAFAENTSHARNTTQNVMKKFGGTTGANGSASHAFEQKGVITVTLSENENMTLDQAEERAIEAEAEEVIETMDDEGIAGFKFICDTKEMHSVKNSLLSQDIVVKEAAVEYIPRNFVTLGDIELELAAQMIGKLQELEHCVRVFDNIQSSS